nr:FAD binding domain-containing protein [Tissierella sp.]
MVKFKDYIAPKSVEEAYEVLISKKTARLIGGGCFIRMGGKKIVLAVDLAQAELDYIIDKEDEIEIGAMTSLRTFETSELLEENFGSAVRDSVKHIIGVQLRNIAVLGATVYSKYGFSDPLTLLLAMDADVYLHKGGRISLESYLKEDEGRRDILEKIIINKNIDSLRFETMRNSAVDYAILSTAFSQINGKSKISVGARPRKATLAYDAMKYLDENGINEETAKRAGEIAAEELEFGDNNRGSAVYRKELCKVLVKRAILGVTK